MGDGRLEMEGGRSKIEDGRPEIRRCKSSVPHLPVSICYLLSLFCFALGLMSKPMLVTLPFVLLLLDYWPLGRMGVGERRTEDRGRGQDRIILSLVLEKVPFFLLSAASSAITCLAQRAAMPT